MTATDLHCTAPNRHMKTGETVLIAPPAAHAQFPCAVRADRPLPPLWAGVALTRNGFPLLRVQTPCWLPSSPHAARGWWATVEADLEPNISLNLGEVRHGLALAWVTLSDKGAAGLREDTAGPSIEKLVTESCAVSLARGFILPDDPELLVGLVTHLSLEAGYDLIITTGGTGIGPRDLTPEAMERILDKRLPGFERAMTAVGLTKTPHAAISRAVAGTLGGSLVLTLPGSPKAVAEGLEAVLPAVEHALDKLHGDPTDCGR